MGQILAKRLQVRNEQTITQYPRQPKGHIDRRFLAQLGAEQYNVFKRSYLEKYRPALIHLSLDGSGSMAGHVWENTLTLATALAYAATKISNLDITISVRGTVLTDHGLALLSTVYDSRRDTFATWRKWGPLLFPNGATPEGLCYEAVMDQMMNDAKQYEMYFVNISDGTPNFWASPGGSGSGRRRSYRIDPSPEGVEKGIMYCDNVAYTHTRQQVNLMRESGIKVLSYLVGGEYSIYHNENLHAAFRSMYGEDAAFINPTEVTGVAQTMNKLLTTRGA